MKNIKNKRSYKPSKISDSLKNINEKFLYKFGKLDYITHIKWPEIVGSFFSKHSEPLKIISIPINKDNNDEIIYQKYLQVNVSPAAAIEFQHFQDKIIEKINSYFGYKAISGIKIYQKFLKKENLSSTQSMNIYDKDKKVEIEKVKTKIAKINDKKLEESIVNLGLSIKHKE